MCTFIFVIFKVYWMTSTPSRFIFFKLKKIIFEFREKGRVIKRWSKTSIWERNIYKLISISALTCLELSTQPRHVPWADGESNWQHFSLGDNTQPSEPHWDILHPFIHILLLWDPDILIILIRIGYWKTLCQWPNILNSSSAWASNFLLLFRHYIHTNKQ